MRGLKILSFLLAVIAVGAIGFYSANFFINEKEAEGKSVADQVKENQSNESNSDIKGTENTLTLSNSEGAVAIKTTLLAEKSNNKQLVFEVVMNTHSVDVTQFDLPQLASITFGVDSSQSGNFEWEPINQDSHHMMGNLIWSGQLDKNYQNINLELKGIDNIPSRNFNWEKSAMLDEILNR